MQKHFRILSIALLLNISAQANNVQIGPVSILGTDTLQFTISWDNSWRVTNNPNNWDAVWVFVKRSDCAVIQWHHANVSDQDADHSATSLLFVDAYTDKKGVMIYRSATGFGNITNVTIKLKLDAPPPGNYQYKVFGIEMVYVPEGAFYLGDGVSVNTYRTGLTHDPYLVTSENSITCGGSGASNLTADAGFSNGGILAAAYPKGFQSFYCMKYEISQGQYADFLNTITPDAVLNRFDPAKLNQNRYTITGAWPVITATAPDRACNWLSFFDLLAYLDWSALSPLTELEYEKACRGNVNNPVAGEYAWSGITLTNANFIVPGTDGLPNEAIANMVDSGSGPANYGNDSVLGPLRCGFAATNATTRFKAGASYYGIMEMTGNVYDLCYSTFITMAGVNFDGTHGDGEISVTPRVGYANQNWPVEAGIPTSEYYSDIFKGGSWIDTASQDMRVSNRNFDLFTPYPPDAVGRGSSLGGRGVSRRQ